MCSLSNYELAEIAQNITANLWDEDPSSQDRTMALMSGAGLGLQSINSGQGSLLIRETCGRYPSFDGSCNHADGGR